MLVVGKVVVMIYLNVKYVVTKEIGPIKTEGILSANKYVFPYVLENDAVYGWKFTQC